jgi:hypothetical protein
MEDNDFFDMLYQGWSKTTGAENTYWMPEGDHPDNPSVFHIWAVDQEQNKTLVADVAEAADAAFITAIHGCLGDLIRSLHKAFDDAERAECEKDGLIGELATLAEENEGLKAELRLYGG